VIPAGIRAEIPAAKATGNEWLAIHCDFEVTWSFDLHSFENVGQYNMLPWIDLFGETETTISMS
jgi:hypothetical protein